MSNRYTNLYSFKILLSLINDVSVTQTLNSLIMEGLKSCGWHCAIKGSLSVSDSSFGLVSR